jgi:hypothetical protein
VDLIRIILNSQQIDCDKTVQYVESDPEDRKGNRLWTAEEATEEVVLRIRRRPPLGNINIFSQHLLVAGHVLTTISSSPVKLCPSIKWKFVTLKPSLQTCCDFYLPFCVKCHDILDRENSEFITYAGTNRIRKINKFVPRFRDVPDVDLFFTTESDWICKSKFKDLVIDNNWLGISFDHL